MNGYLAYLDKICPIVLPEYSMSKEGFLKQPNETSPENVQSLKRKPKDLRIITA